MLQESRRVVITDGKTERDEEEYRTNSGHNPAMVKAGDSASSTVAAPGEESSEKDFGDQRVRNDGGEDTDGGVVVDENNRVETTHERAREVPDGNREDDDEECTTSTDSPSTSSSSSSSSSNMSMEDGARKDDASNAVKNDELGSGMVVEKDDSCTKAAISNGESDDTVQAGEGSGESVHAPEAAAAVGENVDGTGAKSVSTRSRYRHSNNFLRIRSNASSKAGAASAASRKVNLSVKVGDRDQEMGHGHIQSSPHRQGMGTPPPSSRFSPSHLFSLASPKLQSSPSQAHERRRHKSGARGRRGGKASSPSTPSSGPAAGSTGKAMLTTISSAFKTGGSNSKSRSRSLSPSQEEVTNKTQLPPIPTLPPHHRRGRSDNVINERISNTIAVDEKNGASSASSLPPLMPPPPISRDVLPLLPASLPSLESGGDEMYLVGQYEEALRLYTDQMNSIILTLWGQQGNDDHDQLPPPSLDHAREELFLSRLRLRPINDYVHKEQDENGGEGEGNGTISSTSSFVLSRWGSSPSSSSSLVVASSATGEDDDPLSAFKLNKEESLATLRAISLLLVKLGNTHFHLQNWDQAFRDYDDAKLLDSFTDDMLNLKSREDVNATPSKMSPVGLSSEALDSPLSLSPSLSPSFSLGLSSSSSDTETFNSTLATPSTITNNMPTTKLFGHVLNNVAAIHFRNFQYQKATMGYSNATRCKQRALRALRDTREDPNTNISKGEKPSNSDPKSETGAVNREDAEAEVARTLHNIGLLRYKLGKFAKSEQVYAKALSIRVKQTGPAGNAVASTMRNLGDVYFAQNNYDLALRSYREVLQILRHGTTLTTPTPPTDTPPSPSSSDPTRRRRRPLHHLPPQQKYEQQQQIRIAATLHNIGLVFRARGPYAPAKAALVESLSLRRRYLGDTHMDLAETLHLLGLVSTSLHELDDALDSLSESLQIRKKLCKSDGHLLILNTRLAMAVVYAKLGKHDLALRSFRTVYEWRVRRLGPSHPSVSEVLQHVGMLFRDMSDYSNSVEAYRQALRIREHRFGLDSEQVGETKLHLSVSLFKMGGDKAQSMQLCLDCLRVLKSERGPDHISCSLAWKHLGDLYQDRDDHAGALESYSQVLRIKRLWFDDQHLDIAEILNSIGNVHFKKGQYDISKDAFQQSLTIKKRWFDDDHISVYTTLNNLGHAHYKSGDLENALLAYNESLRHQMTRLCGRCHADEDDTHLISKLQTLRDEIDGDHEEAKRLSSSLGNIAATLRNIGLVHQDCRRGEKAMEVYNLILAVRKIQPFPDNAAIAVMAETVGMLHFKHGNHEGAMASFYDALSVKEASQGGDTLDVARTLNNLANVHFSVGHFDQAMELYQRSLEVKRLRLGNDHDEVAKTLNNIAHVMFTSGQDDESLEAYNEVLRIRKQQLGDYSISVAGTYSNMGDVHLKKGNLEMARDCFEQSVNIRKRSVDGDHSENSRVFETLASIYGRLAQWTQAEASFREALRLKRMVLCTDHIDIATTLELLALTLVEQGLFEAAVAPLDEALRIRKLHLGDTHQDVIASLNRIAFVRNKLGQADVAMRIHAEIQEKQGRLGSDGHSSEQTRSDPNALLQQFSF